jgi:hypothetical protein
MLYFDGFHDCCGLVVYLVFYKFISKYQSYDLKDPNTSLFRVVGLLVSLMLSLAFSEVITEVRVIRNSIEREAVAISDTFRNLELFDMERTQGIRTTLVEYAQAVIDDDWPALANDKLGQRTEALKKQRLSIWSKRCNLKSDRDINLGFPGMLLIFIRPVIFMHELPADNIEITYLLRKGTPTDAIIEVSTEAGIDFSCCSTSCSLKTLLFQYFLGVFSNVQPVAA